MIPPKLLSAQYLEGYRVRLVFADDVQGVVDLGQELTGGVFEPLRNQEYFRSFFFNQQFGTIEWDNGADFAPEFLYELTIRSGQPSAGADAAALRKTA